MVTPVGRGSWGVGFALLGESLFPDAEKVTKNACPCIRVSLRSTPLIPSALRGPAYKGHPWPFTPLAASMPLAPLRVDSIRPPERGVRRRLIACSSANKRSAFVSLFTAFQATRIQFPFRRPSVGAAQGDARHGCRAKRDGTWMSLRAGPRSSAGGREVLRSKTRMSGSPSLWLLSLGETRESDSPSRAKPMLQPTRGKGPLLTQSPKSFAAKAAPTKAQHAGKQAKTRPTNHSLIGSEDRAFPTRQRYPFALTTSSGSACTNTSARGY